MSAFATNHVEAEVAKAILADLESPMVRAGMDMVRERYGASNGLPNNQELKDKWAASVERVKAILRYLADDGFPEEPAGDVKCCTLCGKELG